MMRLPRIVAALTLACGLCVPLGWNAAFAADEPPPSATPAPAPAPAPAPSDAVTPPPAAAPSDAVTPPASAPAAEGATTAPSADAAPATTAPADATAGLNLAPASAPSDILNMLPGNGAVEATDQKPTMVELVGDYWHYGKIALWDLASNRANQILAAGAADPGSVLQAFEAVASRNRDNIDLLMLKWESLPIPSDAEIAMAPDLKGQRASMEKMRTATAKLRDLVNNGYATRSGSPDYIRGTIIEMSTGPRAYDNNLPRLQRSGELAAKVAVDILRNPSDRQYNTTARRILRDMGKKAVNPLVAATEMKNYDALVDVCAALGELGYDAAVPYLARLTTLPDAPETVHVSAKNALIHMSGGSITSIDAANAFYDLAEKLYYNTASITASPEKMSYMWFWSEGSGLSKQEVPSVIFTDLMAMRAAEYALKLNSTKGDAVSLWLSANTKRECDLPKGASDPTHKNDPDAHYYNVSSGVQYLSDALGRAIRDHNAAVTLKLTQSLQDIVGPREMTGSSSDPLIQALNFPNRLVRYEAAFALAESLPTKPFPESDHVVPLLVEAMGQSSKANVMVVAPTGDLATLRDAVAGLGLQVASAPDPTAAANASSVLPSVDMIIISEDSNVPMMVDLERSVARLQGTPILVMTHGADSPYAVRSVTDPLMNAAAMPPKANLGAVLKVEIARARQHAGAGELSDQQASTYALRAADLLVKLAITHGQALDLKPAEGGVLTGLSDSRAEIIKAAGRVLAVLDSQPAQIGLATKASDEATPADVRVSLYKSLAASAKVFGNKLDADQVSAVEKVVVESKNADIRGAAAEARGALNLPADQARTLITSQSRV